MKRSLIRVLSTDRFYRQRRPIIAVVELGLIALSQYLACWLRFDGDIPPWVADLQIQTLPWLLFCRGLIFIPFRLYEGLWRYTGLWDLRNIVAGVCTSSAVFYALTVWELGYRRFPRSVYFVDALLLIFLMGGIRLTRRLHRELMHARHEKRVLIVGAGDAGEMIVRDMKSSSHYDGEPIGFIDDDRMKVGRRIHGVPVLGTMSEIPAIIADTKPDEVLVAIPSARPRLVREIVRSFEPYKTPIKTLPSLREIMDGTVTVSQIRHLRIEDLLSRAPVGLDQKPLEQLVRDKPILVTGAGGSIGSELCRQIAALKPRRLFMLDRYENSLHELHEALRDGSSGATIMPIIADVTDAHRVDAIFEQYRPAIVFHAAAHKHVPLMEGNVCEAVKNNVRGTRLMAQTAARHGAERFILISTDKAVNPTSVMGTTKAVAEGVLRQMSGSGRTTYAAVRFGNVLGSNGSVVRKFVRQIESGGPVTVTHPEMRRYFMLISEAVQLVLHAAAMADDGALFVLDMGDQIRIVDMARDLIRLSGLVPEEEIRIEFVGLRPGEKLFEELSYAEETVQPSAIEKILRVTSTDLCVANRFWSQIAALEHSAGEGDSAGTLAGLREIVPSFSPSSEHVGDDPRHALGWADVRQCSSKV
jgi:FlaA1/EpsC-like NDP-sugar epimerase